MSSITNHQYTIQNAFSQCFFRVPDYQREYVWSEREVTRLLEDINDAADGSAKDYFIGTILVSPTEAPDVFDVIDGQQRLTTIFLILCALRCLFKGEGQEAILSDMIAKSYSDSTGKVVSSLRLDPRYENASELMSTIVQVKDDPSKTRVAVQTAGVNCFGSLGNILNAYDTITKYLVTNYSTLDKLQKYFGYLLTNVMFIQISTDISSALKIFETINERGIGLNPMDLLKNLLFSQVSQHDFTKLKEKWKKITGPLDENKEKPLRFLRYYVMANYPINNKRKDGIIREDEIYDWFSEKDNALLCNYQAEPFGFVQHVATNVQYYVGFIKGRDAAGVESINMDNIRRLCGGGFSLHFVLLLAACNFPKQIFDHFLAQLETFLFYYIYTKTPTRDLERLFSAWADELRELSKITDSQQQIDRYNQFLNERFQINIATKQTELNDALNRYSLSSMQVYRTKYLLSKLAQHIEMAQTGSKVTGSLKEFDPLEIEHILPNTPTDKMRAEFTLNNPDIDYEEYKCRLGNLTLLEKPINIVVGNKDFQQKSVDYRNSKYTITSSMANIVSVGNNSSINRMNQKLLSFSNWDATTIDARQQMLIKLVDDIWKIRPFI